MTSQTAGAVTTPQAWLDATDRSVASPDGLLTLGFGAEGCPPTTPAYYRASW